MIILHLACCFHVTMTLFILISHAISLMLITWLNNLEEILIFFFFFLSLDYTVQALDRQSSGKDVRESAISQAVAESHIDSPFTKEETKISKKEIKSLQESSYEYEVQVFESISESSISKSTSVQDLELYQATSISQIAEGDQISGDIFEEARDVAHQILLKLKDVTVKCGDTAQFICVVENGTTAGTTWTHGGVKIEGSERVKQSQNGNVQLLTIQNVQLIDQGLYSCTVQNEHGEKTTSAVLTIEGGYLILAFTLLHFSLTACSVLLPPIFKSTYI
ncbi:uncharacterized protein [Notamacropus eugenii]|uniref:uncharacterized protein n=1 Tax=Notamacropus eugenii TaxID=9315 RepID=UPI003B6775B0